MSMQVTGKIERNPDEEGLLLVDLVLAAIQLQAQKRLLNEVIRVIHAVAPAAQQAAKLEEQQFQVVHGVNDGTGRARRQPARTARLRRLCVCGFSNARRRSLT